MVLPWCLHGAFRGAFMMLPWDYRGNTVLLSVNLWCFHGFCMVLQYHDTFNYVSEEVRCFHGYFRGDFLVIPCWFHGASMGLP